MGFHQEAIATAVISLPAFWDRFLTSAGFGGMAAIAAATIALIGVSRTLRQSELRAMNDRFLGAVELLGGDGPGARRAGVLALASLADDWLQFGRGWTRRSARRLVADQMCARRAEECVETICLHLRSPIESVDSVDSFNPFGTAVDRLAAIHCIKSRSRSWRGSGLSVDLSHATMQGADLRGCDLSESSLAHADLTPKGYSGNKHYISDLTGSNLSGCDLTLVDMAYANLSGVDLRGADAWAANLASTNLSGANMVGVALIHANLSGADLRGADLSRASLTKVILRGANLTDANLSGARLDYVTLEGAVLDGAKMAGSTLERLDLAAVTQTGHGPVMESHAQNL